jgi:hypothetical protein
MNRGLPGFFQPTEMPTAGWWEALWSDPAPVLAAVGLKPDVEVIDLCSSDGWFEVVERVVSRVAAFEPTDQCDTKGAWALADLRRHNRNSTVRPCGPMSELLRLAYVECGLG